MPDQALHPDQDVRPDLTPTVGRPERTTARRSLMALVAALSIAAAGTVVAHQVSRPAEEPVSYDDFALADAPDVTTAPLPPSAAPGIALADDSAASTVARLEAELAASSGPPSPGTSALLADLLVKQATVTGDGQAYRRAMTVLDRAVTAAPDDLALLSQRAATRVTVHDFAGAAADARQVLATAPTDLGALGAGFDAAVETGRYERARFLLQRLSRLAPAAAPVVLREARLAQLEGRPVEAAALTARARAIASADGTVGTARATYDLFAGRLALDAGRYDVAVGAYEAALAAAPGWPAALAGLGRALAASGDLEGAEQALAQSVDRVPYPDTVGALADVRSALGRTDEATTTRALLDVLGQLGGQRTNRALVLARADASRAPRATVALADAELTTRRDVYGYDALSWALLAAGRPAAAAAAADRALALGTQDPRLLAHAGLAYAAAGDRQRARTVLTQALALSPAFDPVLAPRAARALEALGGTT